MVISPTCFCMLSGFASFVDYHLLFENELSFVHVHINEVHCSLLRSMMMSRHVLFKLYFILPPHKLSTTKEYE